MPWYRGIAPAYLNLFIWAPFFDQLWSGRQAQSGTVWLVVDTLLGGGVDYDGFAELSFPPGAIESRLYLSEEGRAEVEADIPRFIGTVHAYVVSEYVERW